MHLRSCKIDICVIGAVEQSGCFHGVPSVLGVSKALVIAASFYGLGEYSDPKKRRSLTPCWILMGTIFIFEGLLIWFFINSWASKGSWL